MAYTHNRIGPWPMIEPEVQPTEITAAPVFHSVRLHASTVYIDALYAGGNPDVVSNLNINPTVAINIPGNSRCSYGIALPNWNTFNPKGEPMFLDFSYCVTGNINIVAMPFVGIVDTASIGPGTQTTVITKWCEVDGHNTNINGGIGQCIVRGLGNSNLPIDGLSSLICGVHFMTADMEQPFNSVRIRQSWRYAAQRFDVIDKSM